MSQVSGGGSFKGDGISAPVVRSLSDAGRSRLRLLQPVWTTRSRWWPLKSPRGEAKSDSPHQVPGTMGSLSGNWLRFPKAILPKGSAPPTASFSSPPLIPGPAQSASHPSCSTEKTLRLAEASVPFRLCPCPSALPAAFSPAGPFLLSSRSPSCCSVPSPFSASPPTTPASYFSSALQLPPLAHGPTPHLDLPAPGFQFLLL